jgi:hypothetical protein
MQSNKSQLSFGRVSRPVMWSRLGRRVAGRGMAARSLGLCLIASLLPGMAMAQTTLTWGAGGAGGSGTWNGSNTNWYNGSSNVAWSGSTNNAVFAGTAGTVSLGANNLTANSLLFNTAGYTLAFGIGGNQRTLNVSSLGGTALGSTTFVGHETLNTAGAVQINFSGNTSFSGTVANNGTGVTTFQKGGTGRLTLAEGFNYTATGNFGINAGSVRLGTTSNLPSALDLSGSIGVDTVLELAAGNVSRIFDSFSGNRVRLNGAANNLGFAAIGADRTLTMTNGADVVWGNAGFLVSTLILGTDNSTGKLTFTHTGVGSGRGLRLANTLGTTTRTIRTDNGSAAIDAEITMPLLDGSTAGHVGALTKTGSGVLALAAVNTYTGPTTVSAGGLWVASTGRINSTSGVTVNGSGAEFNYNSATAYTQPLTVTQGIVSGTGTISASGGVTIGTNAVLSPGNSPGIQAYTTGLTWAGGGSYLWEINDWTGGAGTAYDQVQVTGGPLDITASSPGNLFTINITSLSGSAAGAVGNWSNTSKTFTIATALSGGGVTNFDASKFSLNTTQFSAQNPTASGMWSISSTGSTVLLNYNVSPAFTSTTYTLGASSSAATIFVGGTSSITATVTNTGTGTADSLGVTGLGVSVSPSGSVTLSPTSGTAANANGTVPGSGNFTPIAAGSYVFTPTVTSATNVNLGTTATATGTSTTTVSVLAHTAPTLSILSGGSQTIITGGTFAPITYGLANPGSNVSPLQVANLSNLTGLTGTGAVAVGGTGSYTLASLPSSVTVATGSVTVGLDAGDQQSLSGANPLQTLGGTTNYTVLAHSQASLAGGLTPLTSTTISLGEWNWQTNTWTSGSGSSEFSLFNLAFTSPASLTAALDVTGTSFSGNSGFSTNFNLGTYSLIDGGNSANYLVSFTPSGTTSGLYSATFTFQTADQNLPGKATGDTLTLTANVVVVPEPGAVALAGIGVAVAAWAFRRRRAV